MKPYHLMSKEELASLKEQLTAVYKEYQGKNLSLNMARGKPCSEQLDLSLPMLEILTQQVITTQLMVTQETMVYLQVLQRLNSSWAR